MALEFVPISKDRVVSVPWAHFFFLLGLIKSGLEMTFFALHPCLAFPVTPSSGFQEFVG
jgi:hypothetical protein